MSNQSINTQELSLQVEDGFIWHRYRFYTKSVDDPRPLVFNYRYPFWISGYGNDYAIIVAYLPTHEKLTDYWDDAYEVEFTKEKEITFTGRFQKPNYMNNNAIRKKGDKQLALWNYLTKKLKGLDDNNRTAKQIWHKINTMIKSLE